MKFSITIDNISSSKKGLSIQEAYLYAWMYSLPSWADMITLEGKNYYFASRSKAIDELPLLTDKPDTMYRYYKSLESKGLIVLRKIDNKDYIRLTDFSKEWNNSEKNPTLGKKSDNSEKNPTLGKKSDNSEKNPKQLGKFSENNSEKNPTYNNISIINTTNDDEEKKSSSSPNKFDFQNLNYEESVELFKKHKEHFFKTYPTLNAKEQIVFYANEICSTRHDLIRVEYELLPFDTNQFLGVLKSKITGSFEMFYRELKILKNYSCFEDKESELKKDLYLIMEDLIKEYKFKGFNEFQHIFNSFKKRASKNLVQKSKSVTVGNYA